MPDRSEMSGSENEEIQNDSEDEEMINQELENLKDDTHNPSLSPQVSKQTFQTCTLEQYTPK